MDKVDNGANGPASIHNPSPRAAEYALLPPEAPLSMPAQRLRESGVGVRDRMTLPRAMLLSVTCCSTGVFATVLYQVLSVVHLTALQAVFLVLCTLCFAWIALGTTSALIGFVAALCSGKPALAEHAPVETKSHTALLFPMYHEDAARIAATIEAIAGELTARGRAEHFHVYILSDSRTAQARTRELRAVRLLQRGLAGRIRIYYRSRSENTGKKAGNIADWVRRFGAAYDSFIILDADSVMSPSLIIRLTSLLGANPRVGLIQTVPRLIGANTLFAALQQYAVAFYGPVVSAGFAAWHQESGNYWGHNAIIRTRAFAEAAGLPSLSGEPPLGGHIQSHDFVEAAFLRRAGWEVWMLPDLRGSYEGCPPTLIDTAVRDRRWAQGNLQHLRIIAAGGLPWVSRLHLAMGTYGYLASVFWALSLIVGSVLSLQSAYTLPVYFPDEKTLFPVWPVIDPTKALYLFLGTISVVLLPKVLGICLALIRAEVPRRRTGLLLLGAVIETVFSVLVAPIFMLTQATAVMEILRGKDSGWSVQRREGEAVEVAELVRFHRWHVALGALAALVSALASAYVLAWMMPIVIGLLLAVYLSLVMAKPPPAWISRALATPEAIAPPAIVSLGAARFAEWTRRLNKEAPRAPAQSA
jgi:membrane glycosyltransferase